MKHLFSTSLLYLLLYSGQNTASPVIYEEDDNLKIEYQTTVFQPGERGYDFFRIPAMIKAGDHMLAFAEGRKNSLSDHGQIDIVLKISKDQGKTWSSLIRVTHFENQSCQNPTPVYIPEENKLILLFTKRTVSTDTEEMIRSGTSEGYIGAYSIKSKDKGNTWGKVKEITGQVKQENWRWYAFGPGGAMLMKYDNKNSGRIIIPANHSTPGGKGNDYLGAHVIYSDDVGNSWNIGAADSQGFGNVNPNETTVIETISGTLYFNTRSQFFGDEVESNRAVTYSNDGGESFVQTFIPEPQLSTPVVHCSLTRSVENIFFIGPNHLQERKNLSIWISQDETLTWGSPFSIYENFAAYSSSVMMDEYILGVLAEIGIENPYREIRLFVIGFE